ncbi:MAG: hypothetical protein Q7W45_01065 [Bacteroidota bacterium]|nr:hypothetical protein [Bacteroidota bacterium]MDP3146689.1 hypothetical protein [Bacteroidota bacterium]
MINVNNYKETVHNLDYSTLPATMWKPFDYIKKATMDYTNWNAYDSSEGIKRMMDKYFFDLDNFLQKNPKKSTTPTTETKVNTANVVENEPKVKQVTETKAITTHSVKTNAENKNEEDFDLTFVERIPEELKFIKRFLSWNNKKKTKDDFLRFINSLHRAITERKVTKASPYAKQIRYIQDKLILRYNEIEKPEVVVINPKTFNEFKNLISQERVMPSVMLIKRYITLNGKFGVKEKAQNLIKAMERAYKLKKLTKNDKYNKLLDQMHESLLTYTRSKTQKILSIPQPELNGLNGVLGCHCELSGIEEDLNGVNCLEPDTKVTPAIPITTYNTQLPKGVMSSMEFSNVQFKTLGFVGKYRKLIGDPSKGFTAMVYGKPKMGKSFLCVDFAGYLARNHGKVLYIAREEGLDMTLQEKLNAKDVKHPNLFVADTIPEDLSFFDFIFFDSVNKLGLSASDLETLKQANPNKSFIYVFQTTKEGNFRGANEFQHDVDVVIQVPEKGLAVQNGRFNQGGEMRIFEDESFKQAA